ncbi:MAG: hypothetical protein LH614_08010 [Pyrinomonadaceae bacterium]|nr:hypothetical protein [Pyrinomonadaceae bacterium]
MLSHRQLRRRFCLWFARYSIDVAAQKVVNTISVGDAPGGITFRKAESR